MSHSASGPPERINNFDLLRLFAAMQVIVTHGVQHLRLEDTVARVLAAVLSLVPGVPIFFVISGFLVFWSYDVNPNLIRFTRNRLLRLYPALWMSFGVTCILLLLFGALRPAMLMTRPVVSWIVSQITIFPVYTPAVLRSWGVHTPNGSLWTIVIELQFYALVPVLNFLLRVRAWRQRLAVGAGVSWAVGLYLRQLPGNSLALRLGGVVVIPYLFYFLFGVYLYKEWPRCGRWLIGTGRYWLALYLGYSALLVLGLHSYDVKYWPTPLGFIGAALLAVTTIALAYDKPTLARDSLHGFDISYGLYLYHMLVINTFVALGRTSSTLFLLQVFGITLILALLSWLLIERRALKKKGQHTSETVYAPKSGPFRRSDFAARRDGAADTIRSR